MPKYVYKCKNCSDAFETVHSMDERLTDCEKCNTIGSLAKIPWRPITNYRNERAEGKVVKDYIETAKAEVAAEKERLRSEEWDS